MVNRANPWEQFYSVVKEMANRAEKAGPLHLCVFDTETREPLCYCPLIKLNGRWVFISMILHTAQDHPAALFASKWTAKDNRSVTIKLTGQNLKEIQSISFEEKEEEVAAA